MPPSSISKYNIEHVIKGEDGKLRLVKPDDLYMEKHKGVRDALKMLYDWEKEKRYEEK
jgi:hypothetical protein